MLPKTELTHFPEKIVLLSLDSDTGRFYPLAEKATNLAVAGAVLFELSFRHMINDDWKNLEVLTYEKSGDFVADEAVHCLSVCEGAIPLEDALTLIAANAVEFRKYILDLLIRKGIVQHVQKRIVHAGKEDLYFIANQAELMNLKNRLRQAVLKNLLPEPEEIAIISLAEATGLIQYHFTPAELEQYKDRIALLSGLEALGRVTALAIKKLEKRDIEGASGKLVGMVHGEPKTFAGGMDSVISSIRSVFRNTGIIKGRILLSHINQPGGFNCPGCAWPNPDKKRSPFEFCESGVKNICSEANDTWVDSGFFTKYSVKELLSCSDHWLEQQGRLIQPMILDENEDHYAPVEWEEAFAIIASELSNLNDPDEAVFYSSGRTSNEAAFLCQLLARSLGTNNLPSSANLCHEPSGTGLKKSLGFGKGNVRMEEMQTADLILIFGHNPGSNHPRMLKALQQAVRNGTKIIAVNPMPEPSLFGFSDPQQLSGYMGKITRLATCFVQPKINGDQALIKGIIKTIIEDKHPGDVLDLDFIKTYTTGYPDLVCHIRSLSWETILEASGVSRDMIEKVAEMYLQAEKTIAVWCLGITQHKNSTATVQDIVNLLLLKGNIGKEGAGLMPVRGHSNIQGIRTVGLGENVSPIFREKLEKATGVTIPEKKGLDAISAIKAMHEGTVNVFVSLGGNLLSAAPDTEYTAEAMRNCRLTVMISTKLNRNHLITGKKALILPCLSRMETDVQNGIIQSIMTEDATGKVSFSTGCIPPVSVQLKSEIRIIACIAQHTLGNGHKIPWSGLADDYHKIRVLFTSIVPEFEGFDEKKCRKNGYYLQNPLRNRIFNTEDGKAHFVVNGIYSENTPQGGLLLMSIRSHDQFNTSIFGLNDRYRGIRDERRIVFMNPEDMATLGIAAEQTVDITSLVNGHTRILYKYYAIPYPIRQGCTAAYFPEVNALIPVDHISADFPIPAYKSVPVIIQPSR